MIETLAGARTPGFNGDGLPAAEAELHHPCALTIDGTGNLYLADRDNWRVAGSGLQGHAGDEGMATGAELGGPSGLALDGAGSLYVAEYHNHRVRNIDATGIISTAAGTGEQGLRGDGRLAVEALLDGPAGVVADTAGNLFVSDCGNHRVRRKTARCPGSGACSAVACRPLWQPLRSSAGSYPDRECCAVRRTRSRSAPGA